MHVCVSRGPNGVWGSVLRGPEWFWIEWSLHLCCSHTCPPLSSVIHTNANAHTKFCSTRAALCFQSFYCLMTPNRLHTHGCDFSESSLYSQLFTSSHGLIHCPPAVTAYLQLCGTVWRVTDRRKANLFAPLPFPLWGSSEISAPVPAQNRNQILTCPL